MSKAVVGSDLWSEMLDDISVDRDTQDSDLSNGDVKAVYNRVSDIGGRKGTISQVSLPRAQKDRFTRLAREHGLSLSAFFRLAADEYIHQHDWE